MEKGISIKIPNELKNEFQENKKIYAEKLKISEEELQKLLENDKVVQISKKIPIDMNQFTIGNVNLENKDIFSNFNNWLDFTLLELMKAINIDINNAIEKLDMYAAIYYTEEVLTKLNEIEDKELLLNKIVNLVIEEKGGINDNPKIKDICALFINIGEKKINPYEIADISYKKYKQCR